MDEKRRIQMPSNWRPEEAGQEILLVPVPLGVDGEVYLMGLTPAESDKVGESIDRQLDRGEISPQYANSLRRLFFGKGQLVKLDSVGRICVPDKLAQAANLDREVSAVGTGKRFEIWARDRRDRQEVEDQEKEIEAINQFRL